MTGRPPATFSLRRGGALLVVVLGAGYLALGLAGWPVAARVSSWSDAASYHTPKYRYAAARVAAGELPLWNPLEFCGLPFLATFQPSVFYPPVHLVYGPLPRQTAEGVFFFLHLLLGAFGTLVLARALGAGLPGALLAAGWAMQPTLLIRTWDHPNYIAGAAWLPLVLLALRRVVASPDARRVAALATVAALVAVSGYPPLIIAVAYLAALSLPFWLAEVRPGPGGAAGRVGAVLLAGALAALLAAAQLVPTAELLAQSDREAVAASARRALSMAGAPTRQLLAIRPTSLASTLAAFWQEFGPVPVILAPLSMLLRPRAAGGWFALTGVALAALVPYAVLERLPLFRFVRFGYEWAYLAPFLVYLLAGLGLDAAAARLRWPPARTLAAALVALALLTVWSWRSVPAAWLAWRSSVPPVPVGLLDACALTDGRHRLVWPRGQMRGTLLEARLPTIGGYEQSLLPHRIAGIVRALDLGNGWVPRRVTAGIARRESLAARLALGCVLTRAGGPLARAGFRASPLEAGGSTLYLAPDPLPRARLVPGARWVGSAEESLALLLTGEVDPRRTVVLEGTAPPPEPACPAAGPGEARIVHDAPEEVRVTLRAACPSHLLLADGFFPGWEARVDGRPAPIVPADHALRAVAVGPGTHEVVFRYRPVSVRAGVALSLVGLGALVALAARRPR